jgi:ABC-type tungstate transport system permease subunit
VSRPVIAPTAPKHGIPDEDILHAYRNAIRRFELDDGLAMLVGATRAGELLEIGVVAGDPDPVIVHAMECRGRFLDRGT